MTGKVDLQVIRDLMGHASVKQTEIYAHLVRKNGTDALKKVAEARAEDAAGE
jgi:site-specific recombinase XerD